MKIDLLSVDREQFVLKEGVFCGIPAILVTPAMQGTQWTKANSHLRSSVWDMEGNLLSGGFKKFVNAGENPEHFPMPKSLLGASCVEKMDGSLAIFDYVNGIFSCRTRGTFSYKTLDNAADFDYCIAKYPGIEKWLRVGLPCSVLCEITTPNQKIVIDYGPEPDLTLVGVVYKPGYCLFEQGTLDHNALDMGLKRPRYFTFGSVDSCLAEVAQWNGLEGCVIYSGEDQNTLHKIKSDSYVRAHRFKERVTLPNLLDLFMAYGRPTFDQFVARLEQDFDHECMMLGRDLATTICAAYQDTSVLVQRINEEVISFAHLSRRDAALNIQRIYDPIDRPVAFKCLDRRPLDDKMIRRLMEYTLDKNAAQVKVTS